MLHLALIQQATCTGTRLLSLLSPASWTRTPLFKTLSPSQNASERDAIAQPTELSRSEPRWDTNA